LDISKPLKSPAKSVWQILKAAQQPSQIRQTDSVLRREVKFRLCERPPPISVAASAQCVQVDHFLRGE
jgi:hypothetical protein